MFYDRFEKLCSDRGLSPSRVAIEAGINKSTVTYWKNTPEFQPSGTVIKKLSEYFGITRSELLGEEQKEKAPAETGERALTFDDFTYAMQNEAKDLTDMDKQILLSMAKQLNDARKKKDGES